MLTEAQNLKLLQSWRLNNRASWLRMKDSMGMDRRRLDPCYVELFQDLDPVFTDLNLRRKNTEALFLWFAIEGRSFT